MTNLRKEDYTILVEEAPELHLKLFRTACISLLRAPRKDGGKDGPKPSISPHRRPDHVHGRLRAVARDLVHDGGAQRLGPMRPLFRVTLHERFERLRLERLHLRQQYVLALKLGGSPSCLEQPPVHGLRWAHSAKGGRRNKDRHELVPHRPYARRTYTETRGDEQQVQTSKRLSANCTAVRQ